MTTVVVAVAVSPLLIVITSRTKPPGRTTAVQLQHDLDRLLEPVSAAVCALSLKIERGAEQKTHIAGELSRHIELLSSGTDLLHASAQQLVNALRTPQVRGRWGEMQLRSVVEMAGMTEHCDFTVETVLAGPDREQRPDLIVHCLASGI
jgi:DNA recombination protein RmuC